MSSLDALFLHVPRFDGERREIMVLAAGVPALASLLADDGRSVEIIHLGIESEVRHGFSLRRELETLEPRIVLLSLHWSGQVRPVLEAASRVRDWLPAATIVLGGLTASIFALDIVRDLPFVDCVVRGDGEAPLLALARAVLDGRGSLSRVPNLVWRDRASGAVRDNSIGFVLDAEGASRLRHGDLALLRNRRAYVERALYADFSPGARGSQGYARAAFLNAGRGCAASCPCCGGSRSAQRLTSARGGVLLYPIEKLTRDVRDAVDQGARVLRTSFDPAGSRRHVRQWFAAIREHGLALRLIYDCFGLPSPALLADVARVFAPGSTVVYSPECGSEQVRARIRTHPMSNAALLRSIADAEARGLEAHCFFSAGLPTETAADLADSERLIERILRQTRASVSVTPMVLDPASRIWQRPQRYGVRLVRRTLRDFFDGRGIPDGPGYETPSFDETQILEAVARLRRAAGLATTAAAVAPARGAP